MVSFESHAFYRGMKSSRPTDRPYIVVPRIDRRPRNTDEQFHKISDAWFSKSFGVAYRSHGVFLTSSKLTAVNYAKDNSNDYVVRVIPLSKYKYCWSPKISDLLFASIHMRSSSQEEIESYLESLDYKESGLDDANAAGHEVMLFCERYIAIPEKMLGNVQEENYPQLIILNSV